MNFAKRLPPVPYLMSLAVDAHFPATRQQLARTAQKWGFTEPMTSFLRLFPANAVFQNRADFVARSERLVERIRQEQRPLTRSVLSPQR